LHFKIALLKWPFGFAFQFSIPAYWGRAGVIMIQTQMLRLQQNRISKQSAQQKKEAVHEKGLSSTRKDLSSRLTWPKPSILQA